MKINDKMQEYLEQALDERLDEMYPSKDDAKRRAQVWRATMATIRVGQPDLWRALELACNEPRLQDKAAQEKLDQAINACCDAYNYLTGSRSKGDLLSTLNDAIEAAN